MPTLLGGRLQSAPPDDATTCSNVEEWKGEDGVGRNVLALSENLTEEDVKVIQLVHCATSDQEDFLSWNFTKNREFTVRSAYHREMMSRSGDVVSSPPNNTQRI